MKILKPRPAKMSGFRHKTVSVPEWEGVKVVLREPSGEAAALAGSGESGSRR